MKKDIENAAISFGEWLQENDASYAMFVIMGDKTRFMLNGNTEDVISSIATAMISDELTRNVILEAVSLAADVLNEQNKDLN